MAENKTYNDSPTFIPSRLESSVHSSIPGNGNKGPVADAKDIYDINNGKWQKDINDEVETQGEHLSEVDEALNNRYTKEETYSKDEVDQKESAIKGGSNKSIATLDGEVSAEIERAEGVEAGLRESIDELGQIGLDPENAISTDGDDFDGDTLEKRSKIPTIGSVLDGADEEPTPGSERFVKSGGVAGAINSLFIQKDELINVQGATIKNGFIKGNFKAGQILKMKAVLGTGVLTGITLQAKDSSDNIVLDVAYTSFGQFKEWTLTEDAVTVNLIVYAGGITTAGTVDVEMICGYLSSAFTDLKFKNSNIKPSDIGIDSVLNKESQNLTTNGAIVKGVEELVGIGIDLSNEIPISGYYVISSNGTLDPGNVDVYAVSDFIDISKFSGGQCKITSLFGGWFGCALYTKKSVDGYIQGFNSSTVGVTVNTVDTVIIDIPSNAKFLRFTLDKRVSDTISDYPITLNNSIVDFLETRLDGKVNKDSDFSTISLFETIGVVGDSFASGAISSDGVENPSDHYNVSWPQILARKCGVDVYNYSAGGLSTRTWLTNTTRGLPKLLSDSAKDLYILALGLNDIMISDYLGTIADIKEDYTQNPDTFYGNYARIIEQIQNHAPNAKLIMSTMGRYFSPSITPQYAAFDTAIQEIAEHYGIPCMITIEDDFFKSSYYQNGLVQYHPTAVLYAGMAEAYQRLFVKTTIENYSYYKDFVG